jgi:hypothetical protein
VRQKTLLFVAALVVVAMIVGLVISLRGGEGTASTGGASAAPPRITVPSAAGGNDGSRASPPTPPATPVTPEVKRPQPLPAVEDTTPEVRDHRGEPGGGVGTASPIVPVTIASMRQALGPGVRACAEGVTIADPPARFVVHAVIRAAGGKIGATDVRVTGADALGTAFSDCVERAYAGLATDAGGEQSDGEDTVHMPWTVP